MEEQFVRNMHRAFFEPKVYKKKKGKPLTIGDVIKKQKVK